MQVSSAYDRMGVRVIAQQAIPWQGEQLISEPLAVGSIQIPADGQPIIMLNDRQTLGGYPKIGAVLSLDIAKLTQRLAGTKIRFEAISIDDAHNLLHLANSRFQRTQPQAVS